MAHTRLLTAEIVCLLLSAAVHGSPLTFIDDYEGFVEAAPAEVRSIDFETLPDGSPSWAPAPITPEFNYTHLGVTFLPHHDPGLYIYGNSVTGFHLTADCYPYADYTWIVAEFVESASAVGTYFVSDTTLSVFDASGNLIQAIEYWWPGTHFVGIVSDTPVAFATIDRGGYRATSEAFLFADTPEPSSGVLLLVIGVIGLKRYRGREAAL